MVAFSVVNAVVVVLLIQWSHSSTKDAFNLTESAVQILICSNLPAQSDDIPFCLQNEARRVFELGSGRLEAELNLARFEAEASEQKLLIISVMQSSVKARVLVRDLASAVAIFPYFRQAAEQFLTLLITSKMPSGWQRRTEFYRMCEGTEETPEARIHQIRSAFTPTPENRSSDDAAATTWTKPEAVILLPKLRAFVDQSVEVLTRCAVVCWALNQKEQEFIATVGDELIGIRESLDTYFESAIKAAHADIGTEILFLVDLVSQ